MAPENYAGTSLALMSKNASRLEVLYPNTRFAVFLSVFVCLFVFLFFFTIWALSSLSRDPTCIPCLGSTVFIMRLPGKSLDFLS